MPMQVARLGRWVNVSVAALAPADPHMAGAGWETFKADAPQASKMRIRAVPRSKKISLKAEICWSRKSR
jgi:hypothetical protein